jgi:hypothetical protein
MSQLLSLKVLWNGARGWGSSRIAAFATGAARRPASDRQVVAEISPTPAKGYGGQ